MKKPKSVKSAFFDYSINGVLGEGGTGIVYEASDNDGNRYAIKALKQGTVNTEKLKRFKNEYNFCIRNNHPNIITILDHGIIGDDVPFFVMPFYEGSLRSLIGGLENENVMNIFEKIIDGVEAAHKLGVCHRDIKPENILFNDRGNQIVIADFGIAEFGKDEIYTAVETKDGTRLANFQYAAPEQKKRGENVDHRADIYALGLILNELFTGEIPSGTNFKKIADVSDEYQFLDDLVDLMLEQNPDSRVNTVDILKQELIARGRNNISIQKISELENTVIPVTEIDDPIIREPMQIIDVDWSDNVLTIELNHEINSKWVHALYNMGSYTAAYGKHPQHFQFQGKTASIRSRSTEAQQIIDYFKQWLPKADKTYENLLRNEIEQMQLRIKEGLMNKIAKEKERTELLDKLSF